MSPYDSLAPSGPLVQSLSCPQLFISSPPSPPTPSPSPRRSFSYVAELIKRPCHSSFDGAFRCLAASYSSLNSPTPFPLPFAPPVTLQGELRGPAVRLSCGPCRAEPAATLESQSRRPHGGGRWDLASALSLRCSAPEVRKGE